MQFLRYGRTQCDGCQKAVNSTALEHSRRNWRWPKVFVQHGGYKVAVSLQKNDAAWMDMQ